MCNERSRTAWSHHRPPPSIAGAHSREGGTVLVVGDETVTFYRSLDEFWAEAEDGDEDHRTVTILRETGRPFELAGAR